MTTNLTNLPPAFSPNYLLCISWVDNNHIVYRYAIWKNVGERVFFDLPLYAGQKIGKNFRFEVWSTNLVSVDQNDTMNFLTSVLQSIDYRYGNDIPLVGSDPICTNTQSTLLLPFIFPAPSQPVLNQ